MNVRIGFSTTNFLLSRLIRKVTGATISHCWFLVDVCGKDFVLQADFGGITLTPLSRWDKKWKNVQIITPLHAINISKAWNMLGERYDYGGLLGCAWVYLGRIFKKKWNNPLDSGHAMWCSEFILSTLQASNYPGAQDLDLEAVSPEDLKKFLQK